MKLKEYIVFETVEPSAYSEVIIIAIVKACPQTKFIKKIIRTKRLIHKDRPLYLRKPLKRNEYSMGDRFLEKYYVSTKLTRAIYFNDYE